MTATRLPRERDGIEGATLSDPRPMTVLHHRRPPRPFFALSLLLIIFAVIRVGRASSDYVSDNGSKHLLAPSSWAKSSHTGNQRPEVGCHVHRSPELARPSYKWTIRISSDVFILPLTQFSWHQFTLTPIFRWS